MRSVDREPKSLLHVYLKSEIGGRAENQDRVGTATTSYGTLVVVCDGMGGMGGGSFASSLAVDTILQDFNSLSDSIDDPEDFIRETISHANSVIIEHSHDSEEFAHMGTTVTIALFTSDCATVAHVGDSRIYQIRGSHKIFRTMDHSLVFERVKQHKMTEEQARKAPNSNIILRALGADMVVEPDIAKLPYEAGDRFILCTDGFWGVMPERELLKGVCKGSPEISLDNAIRKADMLGKTTGGQHDNLSAAFIDMTHNSLLKCKMRKKDKLLVLALSILLAASVSINICHLMEKDCEASKTSTAQKTVIDDSTSDSVQGETISVN